MPNNANSDNSQELQSLCSSSTATPFDSIQQVVQNSHRNSTRRVKTECRNETIIAAAITDLTTRVIALLEHNYNRPTAALQPLHLIQFQQVVQNSHRNSTRRVKLNAEIDNNCSCHNGFNNSSSCSAEHDYHRPTAALQSLHLIQFQQVVQNSHRNSTRRVKLNAEIDNNCSCHNGFNNSSSCSMEHVIGYNCRMELHVLQSSRHSPQWAFSEEIHLHLQVRFYLDI
ncbi:hypothetical protein CEXT_61101 [Caerostris extrusa]|uniref:Uncharacterized protein n=1 Tax=Caerostris extrusa TaxID=172846 RepID=A0AAV4SL58_CAEEX|nr:hypothetical protein CEXT_61101 [Caerostris extrusa]